MYPAIQVRLFLAAAALMTTAAAAQPDNDDAASPRERAEFSRLIQNRNELYAQLSMPGRDPYATQGETKWAQNQLDIVEDRIGVLAAGNGWAVPRLPRTTTGSATVAGPAVFASASGTATSAAKHRAQVHKLVFKRNKLHAQLMQLDTQASDLLKAGEKPVVVYAQQVSVQDQLDLIELRLAILSTRYGLIVPPLPGRDRGPTGTIVPVVDEADRQVDVAFARGRERAMSRLRDDADRLLASLDFGAFLSD